jgi:SAM-dependent methyltransferase
VTTTPRVLCPEHGTLLAASDDGATYSCRRGCAFTVTDGVLNLIGNAATGTSEHYELQWGPEVDFGSFYREQGQNLTMMTSKQMGWPALIDEVRQRAARSPLRVLDAGCGYGGLFTDLFAAPAPAHLSYVGADIHTSLHTIKRPEAADNDRALFVRWDISDPLPFADRFDVVICRAVIHHTPAPRKTFANLARVLARGGTLAITAYARKSRMREATDEALRAEIVPMAPADALALARQFTVLGRDLQKSSATIEISTDLPFLGIKAGRYGVQQFIYDYFMKCWFNDRFGERYSDVVNFDWYHPPYACRYELSEIVQWFTDEGLTVVETHSTPAQHFVAGTRP